MEGPAHVRARVRDEAVPVRHSYSGQGLFRQFRIRWNYVVHVEDVSRYRIHLSIAQRPRTLVRHCAMNVVPHGSCIWPETPDCLDWCAARECALAAHQRREVSDPLTTVSMATCARIPINDTTLGDASPAWRKARAIGSDRDVSLPDFCRRRRPSNIVSRLCWCLR